MNGHGNDISVTLPGNCAVLIHTALCVHDLLSRSSVYTGLQSLEANNVHQLTLTYHTHRSQHVY